MVSRRSEPSWELYLGTAGVGMWHVEPEEVKERLEEESVDAVLYEGCAPGNKSAVWLNPKVRCVIWLKHARQSLRVPREWTLVKRSIHHQDVGGVTNGAFDVFIAYRSAKAQHELTWKLRPAVLNVLRQVVDPTLSGLPVSIPQLGNEVNTARGLLDWKRRFARVTVPTVFRKDAWVKRQLSDKELSDVIDLPSGYVKGLSPQALKEVLRSAVPGKVLAELVEMARRFLVQDQEDTTDEPSGVKRSASAEPTSQSTKRLKPEPPRNVPLKGNPSSVMGGEVTDKAVKSDDAKVPTYLWDNRIFREFPHINTEKQRGRAREAANTIRKAALNYWRRKLERDFKQWWEQEKGKFVEDPIRAAVIWERGMEAVRQGQRASWWEWDRGSAIFFWRWPADYQVEAMEGEPPKFIDDPPMSKERQNEFAEEVTRKLVREKVIKVVDRGYIKRTLLKNIKSLMRMFDVPKGKTDVRIVYDGSRSGLNDSLWAPWFSLPTVDTMCRSLKESGWCADNDYGEQFLNFPLHPELQPYCGIDLTQLEPESPKEKTEDSFGMWTRNAMGLKPSPYASVKGALRAKRILLKNRRERGHPFHWHSVKTNLPGDVEYDASEPWIIKLKEDGTPATEVHQYIDDLRITADTEEEAWLASSRIAKICSWLGLQDAARKRRPPSRTPGAWAGAVVGTTEGDVYKTITQERWEKTRSRIRWFGNWLGMKDEYSEDWSEEQAKATRDCPKGHVPFKEAESIRGFLIYVSRTFTAMVPYLKGMHLTLDSWRPGRDETGWKTKLSEDWVEVPDGLTKAPKYVKMVPRFKGDIDVLMRFTRCDHPPRISVRPKAAAAAYLVGDASGAGFGTSLWVDGKENIDTWHGAWTQEVTDNSSNFREALNLVQRVEQMVKDQTLLPGSELFIFTDNSTAERAFYNGTSKSRSLHALVIKLRALEMSGELKTHVVWIAGKRVIAQGTDGLSRGDLTTGVMAGRNFLSFVPLNRSVCERSDGFLKWFRMLLPTERKWVHLTEPRSWMEKGFEQMQGCYIWTPPPALADVALEQLCEIFHVHPGTSHIFICPSLFTARWRKLGFRAADIHFTIPVGSPHWDDTQYEPLTCVAVCPLLSSAPWSVKRTSWRDSLQDRLSKLQWKDTTVGRNCMRQLWSRAWNS